MRELARGAAVAGENRGAVAVFVCIDEIECGVEIRHPHHAQHRAENFFAIDAHVGGDMIEQTSTQKETIGMAFDRVAAAVDDQRCAFGDAGIDIACHFVAMRAGNQRAHFRIEAAGTDLEGRDFRRKRLDQGIGSRVAHAHRHRDRHAAFAGRPVARAEQCRHHTADVGIGHDHHVILRAAQRLHALAVGAAARVDIFGDVRGAHEADRLHPRFVQQRIDRSLVAVDHVEYAVGQTGFFQQIGHEQRCGRVALGRLQHKRVAAGDGDRKHP